MKANKQSRISVSIRVGGLTLLAMLAASPTWALPSDTCLGATPIGALPFFESSDTTLATVDPGDPIPSCAGEDNNVWYSFTAVGDTSLLLDTAGSTFDAVVSVYQGACGVLTEVGCSEESSTGGAARLIVPVAGGDTVLISVSSDPAGGGTLDFIADASATTWGPTSDLEVVVASSDLNPFGSTFGTLHRPIAMKSKQYVFAATDEGIFVHGPAGLIEVALSGDASPSGGTFSSFGEPEMNALGDVAFWASIDGGLGVSTGFYLYTAATGLITTLVAEGDVGPGGGTFRKFGNRGQISLNDVGDVAFVGRETTQSEAGLYLLSGAVTTLMALERDPGPCGGDIRSFDRESPRSFDLNDNGVVVLHDRGHGADPAGVYKFIVGGVSAVACEGAALPSGGVIDQFFAQPVINNSDDVVFAFEDSVLGKTLAVAPGTGGLNPLVRVNDVLTTGEVVCDFAGKRFAPAVNDLKDVAISIEVDTGGVAPCVAANDEIIALRQAPAAALSSVASLASACPFGAFEDFSADVSINGAAEVAFTAQCANGHGAFQVTPAGVISSGMQVTAPTTVGAGFKVAFPSTNVAGTMVVRGHRSAIYGRKCTIAGCGVVATIVAPLDIGPGGKVVQEIEPESLNATTSRIVFSGKTFNTTGESVFLARRSGALDIVADSGALLPGGVGTFFNFTSDSEALAVPSVDGRHVQFVAQLDHPTASVGMFRYVRGVGVLTMALEGDLLPSGATIDGFRSPSVSAKTGVFSGDTSAGDCLIRVPKTGPPLIEEVCVGDVSPIGGTYDEIEVPPSIRRKSIYFTTTVSGGSHDACVFQRGVAGDRELLCDTDELPGGDWIDSVRPYETYGPSATVRGKGVVFVVESDRFFQSIVAERRGVYTLVAQADQALPTAVGGVLGSMDVRPSKNKKSVVFLGYPLGGSARVAIFLGRLG